MSETRAKKYTQTNFSGQQFLHADQREWRPIARHFLYPLGKTQFEILNTQLVLD